MSETFELSLFSTNRTLPPVTELINIVLAHAIKLNASDIHFHPTRSGLVIRLRIDGLLYAAGDLSKELQQEIITRIKILSGLRTDEHQAPQDGRFRFDSPDHGAVDVRVSIMPTFYGENAVLRLLADSLEYQSLEQLGFSSVNQQKILVALRRSHGAILVTGPTGSGKTTTIYTLLKMLNTPEVSIITVEDPIEYSLAGIQQVQANARSGLNFAQGLRSILRQDPNIIMVGEIRDTETATIAMQAALTGHLLISTLHTSNAATTLPRLLDMGIKPYILAATIHLIISQRLVRKLCPRCRQWQELGSRERERWPSCCRFRWPPLIKNSAKAEAARPAITAGSWGALPYRKFCASAPL